MNIEAIVLSIVSITFSSLIAYTVYLIFTYLNKKALGMQTLTDEMVKDSIYLMVLMETISMIVIVVKLILGFTGHSLAILFTLLVQFAISLTTWQCNMIFWVRYLNVFHQAFLNNFDESLIKRTTRCTVGLVSTISVLMAMGSIENTIMYLVMTDGDQIHLTYPITNPIVISMIICLITILGIQFKIVVFKKMVDAKGLRKAHGNSRKIEESGSGSGSGRRYAHNSSQMESGEALDQVGNSQDSFDSKTYQIEILMLSFGILITLVLWFMIPGDDLYAKQLRGIVMRQIIQLTTYLICIKRNEKMFLSCKHQVLTQFCCRTEIIADLNAVTDTHQETNENVNLDQNEDYNEHANESDQGGPSGTTQVQVIQVQPKNSADEDKIE